MKRLILLGFFFAHSMGGFFGLAGDGASGGGDTFSLNFSQATNSFYFGF